MIGEARTLILWSNVNVFGVVVQSVLQGLIADKITLGLVLEWGVNTMAGYYKLAHLWMCKIEVKALYSRTFVFQFKT